MRNGLNATVDARRPRNLGEVRVEADMLRGQVLVALLRQVGDLLTGRARRRSARASRAM